MCKHKLKFIFKPKTVWRQKLSREGVKVAARQPKPTVTLYNSLHAIVSIIYILYTYACIYIYMYVWYVTKLRWSLFALFLVFIDNFRETERETGREIDREGKKERERQIQKCMHPRAFPHFPSNNWATFAFPNSFRIPPTHQRTLPNFHAISAGYSHTFHYVRCAPLLDRQRPSKRAVPTISQK